MCAFESLWMRLMFMCPKTSIVSRDTQHERRPFLRGDHACRKGIATMFVWNGNHRSTAARLRGDTSIDVLIPKSDWNRWRTCRR